MKKILVDVGSSTVKTYSIKGSIPQMIESKSFHLKKNFNEVTATLDPMDQTELFKYFSFLSKKYSGKSIEAYATGVFRKLHREEILGITKKCLELGINFTIVTEDQEGEYLKLALMGRANIEDEILLLNIGGATTELVVVQKGQDIERHNIELGVGTILSEFYKINTEIDQEYIDEIERKISNLLPPLESSPKIAFFSGGELTFMERASYQLLKNELFPDVLHPSIIKLNMFKEDNSKLFLKSSIADMEKLYPENPSWTHGVRSCEIIAEIIFEKYHIETIIPSDANLIDGIALEGVQ